ncbi:MAG: hypothetical protein KGN80_11450, partial [Acidobacteriota bacterium]|nr:hypothetical protein [Acidobacteriota bacterium]
MIPFYLILQLVSMQGTTQQPSHLSRAELHARFKAEALDPQRLLAESRRAKGCQEDVEPAALGHSTADSYTPGQRTKRGSAVHFDLPDDWMYPELKSFPTKRFTPPGDNDSLPNAEGMPVFIPPKARAALPPFSLVESPGGIPLALDHLKGKVLILYFFNPACPHTQVLPEIIRLQSMQSHYTFQVLPVLIGSEKLETIEAFRRLNPK